MTDFPWDDGEYEENEWQECTQLDLISHKSKKFSLNFHSTLFCTSGFATTNVVVSVRHPITYWSPHPLPTFQINIHTGENKIDR